MRRAMNRTLGGYRSAARAARLRSIVNAIKQVAHEREGEPHEYP